MIKEYKEAFGVKMDDSRSFCADVEIGGNYEIKEVFIEGAKETIKFRRISDSILLNLTLINKLPIPPIWKNGGREVYITSESEEAVREVAERISSSSPAFYSAEVAA